MLTDSHSPKAIEHAPANRPARPVTRIACGARFAPATPMTRLRLEHNPSLAPSTAARSALPPRARCRPSSRAIVAPLNAPGDRAASASMMRACERSAAGNPPATASGCLS